MIVNRACLMRFRRKIWRQRGTVEFVRKTFEFGRAFVCGLGPRMISLAFGCHG